MWGRRPSLELLGGAVPVLFMAYMNFHLLGICNWRKKRKREVEKAGRDG